MSINNSEPAQSRSSASVRLMSGEIVGDEDLSGRKFGGFRLINRVAFGGSGTVYRAENPKTRQNVAVKILNAEKMRDKQEEAAFAREFEVGKILQHPNFLQYYNYAKIGKRPFIAMEFFPGSPVNTLWNEEATAKIFRQRAREIFVEMARALEYLHSLGLVHRDIKPGNFLYDPSTNRLKLIDFTLTERKKSWLAWLFCRRRNISGTPVYMSPEQIHAQAPHPTMDIYAFGVILFEYLAGRTPFIGDSPNAVMNQILHSPAPELGKFNSSVAGGLQQLVARILAKKPHDRPLSMTQIVSALNRLESFTG